MVIELLKTLASQGVRLSVEDDQLSCYAQKGALTQDLRAAIALHKAELVSLLQARKYEEVPANDAPSSAAREFPMSVGAKGLYILQQLEPESSCYNIPLCLKVLGGVDVALLKRAWAGVIAWYPILTTYIVDVDGVPVLRVDEECRAEIHCTPLQLDGDQLLAHLRAHVQRPFDLRRGPLVRADLFLQDEQRAVLLVTVHHAIFDGTSGVLLLKALLGAYRQLLVGNPPTSRAESSSYAESVAWEREMLASAEGAKHATYWRRLLENRPPGFQLLPGTPRAAAEPDTDGSMLTEALPEDISEALRALARTQGVTPSAILLSVFALLLRRYTGESDLIVGMPVSTRMQQRFAAEIGYFVNMVPLRISFVERRSFGQLLHDVQNTMVDALYHSSYPFALMAENAGSKAAGGIPIFQVSYAYQNFLHRAEFARLPGELGFDTEYVGSIVQESESDLGLQVFDGAASVVLQLKYAKRLYARTSIVRLLDHYVRLLRAALANPSGQVDDFGILTVEEEQHLLIDSNTTGAPYSRQGRGAQTPMLHRWFESQVEACPDAIALEYEGIEITYATLNRLANRIAHALLEQGVAPDDRVALCVDRSIEMVAGLLGILKAGAAYVPLDPSYPAGRLTYMLEDCAPRALLTQTALRDSDVVQQAVAQEVSVLVLDAGALNGQPEHNPVVDITPRHLAYVIYTSGSTGQPKGVMIEHAGLINYLSWAVWAYTDGVSCDTIVSSPIAFDATITSMYLPLVTGGRAVLLRAGDELVGLEALLRGGRRWGLLKITPAHWRELGLRLAADGVRCSVRRFVVGGEALSYATVRLWEVIAPQARCINEYGPTETVVGCTIYEAHASDPGDGDVPIGTPIDNTQIHILDRHGKLQPIGIPGELYIGGAGLARGYLNRPALTEERFVANPFVPGARMYRTGDLACWVEDGNIEFLGRMDTQVKIRGFRIELGEIEARLNQHPQIEDSAVVARGEDTNKQLVAFYRASTSSAAQCVQLPHEQLRTHLQLTLPAYMVPAAFMSLAEIPLTPSGKVDRRMLERIDVGVESNRRYVAPRTGTEQQLVEIWAEVLNIAPPSIGVDDTFFELGGHSLLATRLLSKIRGRLEVDLPLRTIFERTSIAQLAVAVRDAVRSRGPTLQPIDRSRWPQLPLSFSQERLWFLHQLEPNGAGYNVAGAVRIRGDADIDRLERAFKLIIDRHENLRTLFPSRDGQPYQRVVDDVDFPLARVDLSLLPDDNVRESAARASCQTEAATAFDLVNGPLIRAQVFKLASDDHILMLNMHHIVSDGWSMGVLVNELGAVMDALRDGREAQLPPLPIQYIDYAVWQRTWLEQSGTLGRQLAYWQQKLADIPEKLELATDYPRPSVSGSAGATLEFAVDAPLTGQLKQLAEQHGCTLYMVLLAAMKALLHRYTGQEDICIGTPIANRQYAETEGLIGMFVNTLALRTPVRGDAAFAALLADVKRTCLEAYEHQDTPFEKVVEAVRPQRNMGISPLFQVMVVLQNVDAGSTARNVAPYPLESGISKFDLSVEFAETAHGLSGAIEYSTALYRRQSIERMTRHLLALCRAIVEAPTATISGLDYLGDERQRLLIGLNDTRVPYPTQSCIHELFAQQAEVQPERVAVVIGEQTLSYRQLRERSLELALYLQAQGVGPGTLVGLCVDRSPELIVGLLGILHAGGVFVPLDPEYPADRLAYMLEDSGATLVLTQRKFDAMLSAGATPQVRLIALDDPQSPIAGDVAALQASRVELRADVTASDPAYVIYTSGSTGQPKGVVVEHRSLVNHNVYARKQYRIDADDAQIQISSMSFDLFLEEVFCILNSGAKLIMAPKQDVLSLPRLEALIDAHRVTVLNMPTALFHELAGSHLRLSGLKCIIVGGEKLNYAKARAFIERHPGIVLHNTYGPTETTIISTAVEVTQQLLAGRDTVPIGGPIDNTRVYVLDRHRNPQPIGISGELHIAGDGLARGYLHRPELTQERFVADPFVPGARMYRTGDLVRWLDDGTIEYLGRIDSQVKIRGFRIELGEIEARLNQHPQIEDSAVVASGEHANKQLVAFYRASGSSDEQCVQVAHEQLRTHLQQTLPAYMVPAAFMSLAKIPLTPSGKVDRRMLERIDVGVESNRRYVAPRTETEQQLVEIWAAVLNIAPASIGVDDNFFDLGGHSLLAMRIISEIANRLGKPVPVRVLFERTTLHALAAYVDAQTQQACAPIPRIDRAVSLRLSFAQQRLWFIDRLEGGSAQYNMPAAVQLSGRLDVAALQQALNALVLRHEVLRTNYIDVDGSAVQVVRPALPVPIRRQDLRGQDAAQQQAELRQWTQAEAQQVFDLSRDSMLRICLLQLADDVHALLFTLHHIASDGWSQGVLVREFMALYGGYADQREPRLPALPIQYADYAAWQRERLQGDVLQRQLDYWRDRLAGLPVVHALPLDKPRPAQQCFEGERISQHLDAAALAGLQALARSRDASLFIVLQAAFAVLLSRWSGDDDIVIGTPIAGREHKDVEPLIGLFVNTLVLRTNLSGNPDFDAVLSQARATALAAYEHQAIPFEMLVDDLNPARSLSHTPLFQVSFTLQNNDQPALALPGLSLVPIGIAAEQAKFDLELTAEETGHGLRLDWVYAQSLFARGSIARLGEAFVRLLHGILDAPQTPVAHLPMLSLPERRQLVHDFNATTVEYCGERLVHRLFEAQVTAHPDATAVMFQEQTLSYAELNRRANQLAHRLLALGVQPDARVALCVERSPELLIGVLGILKSGAAYVPLDPTQPGERLTFMLEDSTPVAVVMQSEWRGDAPELECGDVPAIRFGDAGWAALPIDNPTPSAVAQTPQDLAYVIYTSGSTGKPKGVMVHHDGVVNYLRYAHKQYWREDFCGAVVATPFGFDATVTSVMTPWLAGKAVALLAEDTDVCLAQLLDQLRRPEPWLFKLTPAHLDALSDLAAGEPSVARHRLVVGGEQLTRRNVRRFRERVLANASVVNEYGPTETIVGCITHFCEGVDEGGRGEAVPVGRPIANTQIYLLDANREPVPIGVPGELFIGGVQVTRGYLNRPDLTVERFIADPFAADSSARLYRTGDLGRWLPDGTIEYLGRNDFQVKIRGFRIELGEIEARLSDCDGVREAVVLARGEQANKLLVAYYRATESKAGMCVQLSYEHLVASLQQSLPRYMIPAAFISVETIPLTPNGKVDRRALERIDITTASSQRYEAPRTETERHLVEIWAQTLNIAPQAIGINDNFFELGGHSLLAVKLMAKTNARFERFVPLATLFAAPTIGAFAEWLASRNSLAAGIVVPIASGGVLPPLFAVPGAGGSVLVFRDLSNELGADQPFYALQAVGLDGTTSPLDSVEATAEANIAAIKAIQPQGPYRLIGHSYGGVVAYEMARRLLQQGDEVAFLGLLDTLAPSLMQASAVGDEFEELRQLCVALAEQAGTCFEVAAAQLRQMTIAELVDVLGRHGLEVGRQQFETLHGVFRANLRCYRRYRPLALPQDTDVRLFRATQPSAEDERWPVDYGWNDVLQRPPRIHKLDADHFSMLAQPDVPALADLLR